MNVFGTYYRITFKYWALTCCFIVLFCSLGTWQYHRAQQKRLLIQAYTERRQATPISSASLFMTHTATRAKPALNAAKGGESRFSPFGFPHRVRSALGSEQLPRLFNNEDHRFYPIQIKGHFDNQHQIFLDNRTYQGQTGYEVYTPFILDSKKAILIDRGWVPASIDRSLLPQLPPASGHLLLKGVLNLPPAFFALGAMVETQERHFPLRIQYVDLNALSTTLGYPIAAYVVWLDPNDPHGFKREWKVNFVGPEKHMMYAVQWFAFAISLLVIFGVLNLHRQ